MRTFLALRSLLFVFLIPGVVAGYIPLRILQASPRRIVPGLSVSSVLAGCLIGLGAVVLLRCVWDFFAAGRGTLAPIDPPRLLVVQGLYRFTRNPMYNGVLAVILGEAWLFHSTALLRYAALMFLIFHLTVVLYEEPALASRFGELSRLSSRGPALGFHRPAIQLAAAVLPAPAPKARKRGVSPAKNGVARSERGVQPVKNHVQQSECEVQLVKNGLATPERDAQPVKNDVQRSQLDVSRVKNGAASGRDAFGRGRQGGACDTSCRPLWALARSRGFQPAGRASAHPRWRALPRPSS
jgi:protein-S-isoprenylcysteine O-methyltransferase Ste14